MGKFLKEVSDRKSQLHFIAMFFFSIVLSGSLAAQPWDFIKEKDSIKIYTRTETGRSLKSYKAVTAINSPAEKIISLMGDTENTDWWDKKLIQIKVLLYEKDKKVQYYMIYDLPWPVADRDLCVNVTTTTDTATGEHIINAVAFNGSIPERDDMKRIKDYRQTWTITPAGRERTNIILEGFVDPAGAIPSWISNMLITESPLKAISGLREAMRKKRIAIL